MCSSRLLYYDKSNGYISRCEECRQWQLAFGNLVLSLKESEFSDFIMAIRQLDSEAASEMPACKMLKVDLTVNHIKLVISYQEWLALTEMLDAAATEHTVLRLLDLFKA